MSIYTKITFKQLDLDL